jgi:hypothetical protein
MAINFPNSPTTGETFTENGVLYTWDGAKWTANKGSADLYVEKTGDTMTGDLTAPVVKATDHMEGVGKQTIISFNNTEEEVAIPTWANRIELACSQVTSNSSPGFPFEIRVKVGTGANYGTVSNNNAMTTWINAGSGGGAGAAAPASYWRMFLPYLGAGGGAGDFWTLRGIGTIHMQDNGALWNVTGSVTGVGHDGPDISADPFTFVAGGFGNIDTRPGFISFKTTTAALPNSVAVTFFDK